MLKNLYFKIIFCLCFLVLSLALSGTNVSAEADENVKIKELRLAAWNIKFLGGSHLAPEFIRDDEHLQSISGILSKYDFIAVTELMTDTSDLDKILTMLSEAGHEYGSLITEQIGLSSYKERYAFLYRKKRVKLVKEGGLYKDRKVNFDRPPYWATFQAGNFDFTVGVVHILADDGDDIDHIAENGALGRAYRYIQRENGNEEDVILVGDFNLSPDHEAFKHLKEEEKKRNRDTQKREVVHHKVVSLFNPPQTTNIKDTHLYDNIFIQPEYVKEYLHSTVDRFDETDFGNDDDKAIYVSDHRPVWAAFRIDLVDDDPSSYADNNAD